MKVEQAEDRHLCAQRLMVLYIARSKRLFGLRGGRAAFDAERHSASLLEVELAAGTAPGNAPSVRGTSTP